MDAKKANSKNTHTNQRPEFFAGFWRPWSATFRLSLSFSQTH